VSPGVGGTPLAKRKLEELERQKLLPVAELESVKRRGSAEQQLVDRTLAIGNVQAVARLIVERRTEMRAQKLYSVSASSLPREVRQTLDLTSEELRPYAVSYLRFTNVPLRAISGGFVTIITTEGLERT
jgi:hypothetical protein